jgi:hypothetical protein
MADVCKIEGCERVRFGHGYCNAHYSRWRRYGDPLGCRRATPVMDRPRHCTVEGCSKSQQSLGLCSTHYHRKRRGQDMHALTDRQKAASLQIDEIVRLYTIEKYSTVQLAKRFGVADVTISAMLKSRGVAIRGPKSPRIHFRGLNNPNWKADRRNLKLTKSQSRPASEIKEWRLSVMSRDEFTCQACGNSKDLQAHHIESWSTNPDKRFLTSNGITFCRSCHTDFHSRFGKRNNNRTQLAAFLAPAMEIAA